MRSGLRVTKQLEHWTRLLCAENDVSQVYVIEGWPNASSQLVVDRDMVIVGDQGWDNGHLEYVASNMIQHRCCLVLSW